MSQRQAAQALGVSQSAISGWTLGDNEPLPATVFAIESKLDLPPGHLSRHLGYVPLVTAESGQGAVGVEDAINSDPMLPPLMKRALIAAYQEASRPPRRRR
jgi:transcriptional regulator with XRE-family HTH domain